MQICRHLDLPPFTKGAQIPLSTNLGSRDGNDSTLNPLRSLLQIAQGSAGGSKSRTWMAHVLFSINWKHCIEVDKNWIYPSLTCYLDYISRSLQSVKLLYRKQWNEILIFIIFPQSEIYVPVWHIQPSKFEGPLAPLVTVIFLNFVSDHGIWTAFEKWPMVQVMTMKPMIINVTQLEMIFHHWKFK